MAAGLSSAETMLNASDPNAIKGIVFLSDGWFNVGGPPFNIANQLKGNGVKIWTIGLGTGVDAVTLRKLASTPQDYFAVPNENELQAAFDAISAVLCRK